MGFSGAEGFHGGTGGGGGGGNAVILLGAGTGSSYRCGNNNCACGDFSTVSGGYGNTDNQGIVQQGQNSNYSVIAGGLCNQSFGTANVVSGGICNTSSFSGYGSGGMYPNTISGGFSNFIGTGSGGKVPHGANVIGGGHTNTISSAYTVNGNSISGGYCNTITDGYGMTISGGYCNTISATYGASTISGGYQNLVSAGASIIAGGYKNIANCYNSTIMGGYCNTISGYGASILGGSNNTISGCYSTASGYNNTISGAYSSAFGCGLTASANCTLYANNFCACGTYATCSIPTSCAVCIGGVGGDKLVGYTATNYPRDYGSFYDITDQQTLGNVEELMEYGNTDLSNGVSIVNNGLGNPTQITVSNTGVYNIQFSAQLAKGVGPVGDVYFYLKKNGNPVPETNTQVTLANNNVFLVVAWNYFLQLNAGEYAEIAWYSTSATITLKRITSPLGLPDIPSVILTVSQL